MFFCENCGNKIDNNNNFCVNCGNKINRVNNNSLNVKNEESNWLKSASIVLGSISIVGCITLIFFPISIILSIIGLILGIIATKKGKNMLGIILNVIGLLLSILIIFIIVLFMGTFRNDEYEEDFYRDSYDYRNFMNIIDDKYY